MDFLCGKSVDRPTAAVSLPLSSRCPCFVKQLCMKSICFEKMFVTNFGLLYCLPVRCLFTALPLPFTPPCYYSIETELLALFDSHTIRMCRCVWVLCCHVYSLRRLCTNSVSNILYFASHERVNERASLSNRMLMMLAASYHLRLPLARSIAISFAHRPLPIQQVQKYDILYEINHRTLKPDGV